MILVDINQVMISNLMQQIGGKTEDVDPDLIRHMILNSLRMYRQEFGDMYGELVICCDDKKYWRREVFPYYKMNRKKDREKSGLDWNNIFQTLNQIRDELKEHFPYKVIQVEGAEADDIIGTLCQTYGHIGVCSDLEERILILSSDKDFLQLQKYCNVIQYSPVQKMFIQELHPHVYLNTHIIRGDKGDGIPNFLSDDDTFVEGKRQKPISTKKLDIWCMQEPEEFCDEKMLRGYKRNQQLVDLDFIPEDIRQNIIKQFKEAETNQRSLLLNYFIQHKLKNLTEVIDQF